MKLLEFHKNFPDEESCRLHWKQNREEQGIVCKHCKGKEHKWNEKHKYWICKKCYFRTSLKNGTVMQNSNLKFRDWYIAMHLLTSTKHAFSAKELQKELDKKRYEPCWAMLHKLRNAMGERDENYVLQEFLEFDEAFFSTFSNYTKKEKREQISNTAILLKRGKGSQKKSKVLVMTESKPASEEEQKLGGYKKSRKINHVKMIVVEDLKKETINAEVEKNIDKNSEVRTDGSNSYADLKKKVKKHDFKVLKTSADVNSFLPWVHTMVSNAKRTILGIHYLVGKGYIQQYLNEFCYKINRRFFGEKIFDRIIVAAINSEHRKVIDIKYDFLHHCG